MIQIIITITIISNVFKAFKFTLFFQV